MHTCAIALLSALASLGGSRALVAGSDAPAFEVTDTLGQSLTLDGLTAEGPLVLVFFPKANSPGCNKEVHNLTVAAPALEAAGAHIVVVSGDGDEKLSEMKKTLGANFSFVSDSKGLLMGSYGTKMPMISRSSRRTLLIGQDKKVKLVLRDGDAIELTGLQEAVNEQKSSPASNSATTTTTTAQ